MNISNVKRVVAAAAVIALAGCATLEKPETALVCRAADVGTTAVALHLGAVEANPIMGAVLAQGWLPFLLLEGAIAVGTYYAEQHMSPPQRLLINTIGCVPAVSNLAVINQLR